VEIEIHFSRLGSGIGVFSQLVGRVSFQSALSQAAVTAREAMIEILNLKQTKMEVKNVPVHND
jgi:hypothetical protein